MKKFIYTTFAFALVSLTFLSCSKDTKSSASSPTASISMESNESTLSSTEEVQQPVKKEPFTISNTNQWYLDGEEGPEYFTFSDVFRGGFDYPFPIGHLVMIIKDTDVYKAPQIYDYPIAEKAGYAERGAEAYLLMLSHDWCRICDRDGNSGWISEDCIAFRDRDAVVESKTEKKGYPVAIFTPDNKYICMRSYDDDGIAVCDPDTLETLYTIRDEEQNPPYLACSPDSRYLYHASDRELWRFNFETKQDECLGTPTPYDLYGDRWEHIKQIYPSPDGRYVICGVYYENFAIYDLELKEWHYKTGGEFMWAQSFAYSPDGKFIAGCASNPTALTVWNRETREVLWQQCEEIGGELYYSKDGKYLYVVNSALIAKKDALTGRTIETHTIDLPSDFQNRNWVICQAKDRLIITGDVSNPDNNYRAPMLYVFSLSTGKLCCAEGLNYPYGELSRIQLNKEGTELLLEMRESDYSNKSTQVLCSINLDDLPPLEYTEPGLTSEEQADRDFVLNNSFQPGYRELYFNNDQTFYFASRYDLPTYGTYYIENGFVYMSNSDSFEDSPVDLVQQIDRDYMDFDYQGRIGDYMCSTPSPAGAVYDYQGTSVIKYPTWGDSNATYIYIQENLKMRKYPSTDADEMFLPYYYYSEFNEESFNIRHRSVVFAGDYFRVIGRTDWTQQIDDKDAPWYLIYADDNSYDEYSEGFLTWVYGGWCTEFSQDQKAYYASQRQYTLDESVSDWYREHPDDGDDGYYDDDYGEY